MNKTCWLCEHQGGPLSNWLIVEDPGLVLENRSSVVSIRSLEGIKTNHPGYIPKYCPECGRKLKGANNE